ncbi:MAG: CocE/NonD family hydrolase [Paracoccaceae bacterium]|nr:CocE/NonD family hydrolase [Paracoccaceae bacterium]
MAMGQFKITEDPNMGITLSDGTRLSARVWMPEDANDNPVPVILEYLPYRKRDGTVARDALTHPYFASHGYACLRVDIRGNGDSEGVMEDEYSPLELADCVEVINWAAAQPWCSGTVGMIGISWGGFNSLQVAALQPEPLKAIITLCSTVDRFADDIHYKGGCLLNENLGWSATMLSYSSRAPDPELVGENWRDMWLERLRTEPHLAELWASHQQRDAYWKHGSVCEDFSAIKAAVLAVGGWGDSYKNAVQALVENVSAPVKGIVGPWVHKYPHFAVPEPRIGFLQEALRWWDRWLKGRETGVESDPDLRLFTLDSEPPQRWYTERSGRWVDQNFRNAPRRQLHLNGDALSEKAGPVNRTVASPADTGADAGEYCAIWLGPEMPGDQRRDDATSTCFDSTPLSDSLAVVGAPEVSLTLTADAPVAQLAVRLNDVRPDGSVVRITYGVLNLTHRDSAETPSPLPVGKPVTVSFKLDQIAYQMPPGHRLRLSVSNAYWPLIWPAPGQTNLRLESGSLTLPLLNEGTGDPDRFLPPEAAEPWANEELREPSHVRRTILDQQTGVTTLEIIDDFGLHRDRDHGMEGGTIAREWWSIHPDDPLSAHGRTHWTDTRGRGDWQTRTETFSEMSSDATHLHLRARIEAYEDDQLIFEKDFDRKIPRDLV